MSILRNCLCAVSLDLLFFCIKYVIACLLYFLQSFCSLLDCLFLPNCWHLHFVHFDRFCISNLLDFSGFLSFCAAFFCVLDLLYIFGHADLSHCITVVVVVTVFGSFRVLLFCMVNTMSFACFVLTYFDFFGGFSVNVCAEILE